jgi:hypothetical protein
MVGRDHNPLAVAKARRAALQISSMRKRKDEEEEEERETLSHARYLVAAIDVNYLASDRCGSVAGEENSGGA